MRKRCLPLLAAAILVLCSSGCGAPGTSSAPLTVLTIGTADTGGTMYPVGSAIAEALSSDTLKINLSASTGSQMNIQTLSEGEVDLALVSGDTAYAAFHQAEYADLRAVAAVFTSVSNWLAPVSIGAEYVHDLSSLRIGVGPENSTTELSAQAAIKAIGLDTDSTTLVNCGLGAGTEMVLDHQLDAIHGFSGTPISSLSSLSEKTPCRTLKYTEEELDAILTSNTIYVPATLPANTYAGQTEDIATFGVKCLLCVDASMDEELVYSLTEALWNARESLSAAHSAMSVMDDGTFLYEDLPIPLHSGAEQFYTTLE